MPTNDCVKDINTVYCLINPTGCCFVTLQAWGDVSTLNKSKIVEMGCLSQSFNAKQLQNLSITSLDTLDLLSVCQWNQTQVTYTTLLLTHCWEKTHYHSSNGYVAYTTLY